MPGATERIAPCEVPPDLDVPHAAGRSSAMPADPIVELVVTGHHGSEVDDGAVAGERRGPIAPVAALAAPRPAEDDDQVRAHRSDPATAIPDSSATKTSSMTAP